MEILHSTLQQGQRTALFLAALMHPVISNMFSSLPGGPRSLVSRSSAQARNEVCSTEAVRHSGSRLKACSEHRAIILETEVIKLSIDRKPLRRKRTYGQHITSMIVLSVTCPFKIL